MNENTLFKEAANAKMPNIEEVRNRCISQDIQLSVSKSHGSIWFKRVAPMTACTAIVLVAILAVPQINNNSAVNPPVNNSTPYASQPYQNNVKSTIQINEMTENPVSASRRYFDPEKTYIKEFTLNEIIEYLGKDIRPTVIPSTVKASSDFANSIIYNNDDTVAFDQFTFVYNENSQDGYNPLEKQLRIFVSKTNKASDCIYVWSKDMMKSQINGQKLMIGKRKIGYGPYTVVENGQNTPAGYYDLFVAEFDLEGISYQVVSDNFTQDEFIDTLTSIIK